MKIREKLGRIFFKKGYFSAEPGRGKIFGFGEPIVLYLIDDNYFYQGKSELLA